MCSSNLFQQSYELCSVHTEKFPCFPHYILMQAVSIVTAGTLDVGWFESSWLPSALTVFVLNYRLFCYLLYFICICVCVRVYAWEQMEVITSEFSSCHFKKLSNMALVKSDSNLNLFNILEIETVFIQVHLNKLECCEKVKQNSVIQQIVQLVYLYKLKAHRLK